RLVARLARLPLGLARPRRALPGGPVEELDRGLPIGPGLGELLHRQAARELGRHEQVTAADAARREPRPVLPGGAMPDGGEADDDPGPVGRLDLVAVGALELEPGLRRDRAGDVGLDALEPRAGDRALESVAMAEECRNPRRQRRRLRPLVVVALAPVV